MAINSKSTKDQILKAYNTLEKEKKEIENKLRQAEREVSKAQSEAENAKTKLDALKHNQGTVATEKTVVKIMGEVAKVNSVEGIILTLESVDKGLGTAISEIATKLTLEAESLAELLKQTQEKTAQLKSLYKIEIGDETLDKLLDEFEQAESDFAEEFKRQSTEYEDDMNERYKAWRKEQQKYEKTLQERNETTTKNQKREFQEYQYEIEHARSMELDIYEQKKKKLQQDLDDLREVKTNEWNEKEKLVKMREDEWVKYKAEFEQLPEKTDKEVKKAEAEGKAIIEKDAKVKADLFAKEVDSQKRMYELKAQTLQSLLESRKVQIESLSKQLEAAHKQAQDLAIKAIEGSSNLDKFNAVKEIANELAKNQPKTK